MILPGAARHAPPSRGATISARARRRAISGARKRKRLPYQARAAISRSGLASPAGLTGKPFAGLSWLSCSRSPFSFGRSPAVVSRPDPPVARAGAPHASGVARRGRDINPDSRLAAFALAPPAGFPPASHRSGPAHRRGACPRRPRSSGLIHRVEPPGCPAVLDPSRRVLAGGAPVAPDERLSTHPALRAGRSWRRVRPPPFPPSVAGSPGAGRRSVPPPAARCAPADGLRTSPARPGRTPMPTDFNENRPHRPGPDYAQPNRTRPIPASP